MRLPSAVILAAVAAFAFLNIASTFSRSAIPYAIHGEIDGVERRIEKHPGVDDVYLVTVAGRTLHVDPAVGVRVSRGERVDKRAWSRSMTVGPETLRLRPSADFRRMVAVMPLLVLASLALVLSGGLDGMRGPK